MEIRNLVTFLKVTELNSFSKAAEALDFPIRRHRADPAA